MKLRSQRRRLTPTSRRSRQGFTLLELLLVMAILVVLVSLSSFAYLSLQQSAYSKSANVEIQRLATACQMYKVSVGAFPNKLQDLHTRPSGLDQATWGGAYIDSANITDPWNRPYKYTPNDGNNTVLIQSSGPDGQMGSEDDVSNSQGT